MKTLYASFGRFEIAMIKEQSEIVSHSGDCLQAVNKLLQDESIKEQLGSISDSDLSKELGEYGTWTTKELVLRSDNEQRIVWIAGNDLTEELYTNQED